MFGIELWAIKSLNKYQIGGDFWRSFILLGCYLIYMVRLFVTLFVFYRRKMVWFEAIVILNFMPFIFPYISYISGKCLQTVGLIEAAGVVVFLLGSYLNTASEWQRHYWKQKAENKGKLYTQGLFKHAIHINYLGDGLIFTGLVIITRNTEPLFIPVAMMLNFIIILIPLKNRYLNEKYGEDFNIYENHTKKLIPFIF